MQKYPQPFITLETKEDFADHFKEIRHLLIELLNSPVTDVYHIGGTKQTTYLTEPILNVLVIVNSLHDITSLDEKRLNYHQIYRLHHNYSKKVIMAQFADLKSLKQIVRLHIVEQDSQMLYDYLSMEQLLATDDTTIQLFNQFKTNLCNRKNNIKAYEEYKQQWFEQILKNTNC